MSYFRKFDAGDGKRSAIARGKDCQVRALCTARGIPYGDAWALLYAMQAERRSCFFELVAELDDVEGGRRLGVVRALPFPARAGHARMTGEAFCREHPRGRFILRMAHHVAAVKDGQLYDTRDTSARCVYKAWEILPAREDASTSAP